MENQKENSSSSDGSNELTNIVLRRDQTDPKANANPRTSSPIHNDTFHQHGQLTTIMGLESIVERDESQEHKSENDTKYDSCVTHQNSQEASVPNELNSPLPQDGTINSSLLSGILAMKGHQALRDSDESFGSQKGMSSSAHKSKFAGEHDLISMVTPNLSNNQANITPIIEKSTFSSDSKQIRPKIRVSQLKVDERSAKRSFFDSSFSASRKKRSEKQRNFVLDKLALTMSMIITLVIVLIFIFILSIFVTSGKQKVLESSMAQLGVRVEQLFDGLEANGSVGFVGSLHAIRNYLNMTERRISALGARADGLGLKLQEQIDAQESVNDFMRNEVSAVNENLATFDRNLQVFKANIENNQQNSAEKSKQSLEALKNELKTLEERIVNALEKPKRIPKRMRLSFKVGRNGRLAVFKNGDLAVSGENYSITIWDTRNGTLKHTLYGHRGNISAIAVLPNGNLISGSADRTLKIWSEDGKILKSLPEAVSSLAVFGDDRFASGSFDGKIKIWSRNGSLIRSVAGHTGVVNSLIVLPNDVLVSAAADGAIKMWGSDGNLKKKVFEKKGSVHILAVDTDGDFVSVLKDEVVYEWSKDGELRDNLRLRQWDIRAFCVLPNGDLATSSSLSASIAIYDRDTTDVKRSLDSHRDVIVDLKVLPNDDLASSSQDGYVKIWRA